MHAQLSAACGMHCNSMHSSSSSRRSVESLVEASDSRRLCSGCGGDAWSGGEDLVAVMKVTVAAVTEAAVTVTAVNAVTMAAVR